MPNLLFCMTPGVGLSTWRRIGSLDRELMPYTEYVRRGWKVKILTFDRQDIPELPDGMVAVRFLHHYLLGFLPWVNKALGRWADVIKTNQSNKAFFYTRTARNWGKPILLRCGYVHGEYLESTMGLSPWVRFYQRLEARAFKEADHCEVPTEELSLWIRRKYEIPGEKISVVPNFVDMEIFRPLEGIPRKERSVVAVGNLSPIKQFDLLIKACSEIPGCRLTIVGEGPQRENLVCLAREIGVCLDALGNLPNDELPTFLQRHHVFVISSKWEGHPKVLLEAMACGMPCVGTNVPGIRNLIKDRENGLLVETTVSGIKSAVISLFNNEDLCDRLGRKAREFVAETNSFQQCFEKEFHVITALLNGKEVR